MRVLKSSHGVFTQFCAVIKQRENNMSARIMEEGPSVEVKADLEEKEKPSEIPAVVREARNQLAVD